jgi:phage terminase large subunit-like protein
MGLRGPGAARAKKAREQAAELDRDLPWEKAGLTRAQRVIAFLEFLPVTKGRRVGENMVLLPKQRRFVRRVYGRVVKDRVRLAIKSEPKGNGKTGLVAGLALCHLIGPEAEPRGEVYSASIDRGMASIVFNEMEAIILAVLEFACRVNIQRFHKRIEVLSGDGDGSIYEALSSDARSAHGRAPSFWAYDELAQARDGELLDNLRRGAGKRHATLGMVISTQAQSDDHPLSVLIDDALEGHDPTVILELETAPMDADPFDIKVIRACNPAVGAFLDLAEIEKEAEEARRVPIYEARFRNLRLNQRIDTNTASRILTPSTWQACTAEIDMNALKGRTCFGGLDLSGKHDLTALVLAFPDDEPDVGYDLLSFFWTPEGQLKLRAQREQELFRAWIDSGHMYAVPGDVIRFRFMAAQLADLAQEFDIQAIGYDRWRIDDFKSDMADEGVDLPLEPYGQGFKDMSPAVEYFVELALSARLRHSGNPVLNACVSNAITVSDPAGNLKVDKERSNQSSPVRIDGLQAALIALGTAKRFESRREAPLVSIYSRPELWGA